MEIPESCVAVICIESYEEGIRINFHLFPDIFEKCKKHKIALYWKYGHVYCWQRLCARPTFKSGYMSFLSPSFLFANELLTILLRVQKTQVVSQLRFSTTPGHIPHVVICSRKPFEIAPSLKLEGHSLDADAGGKAYRLTPVETEKYGIGIQEGGAAHMDGKSLRGKAVARLKLACPSPIGLRHIVGIVPDLGEKYPRGSSTYTCAINL